MAARLSIREKRLIQAAIVLAILVLLYLLFRGGGEPAPLPVATPQPAPLPAPLPPPVAQAPMPPQAPPADLSGLSLHGLLASGAVIGFPDGRQRLVPVGREALPGLMLRRIEQGAAVFDNGGGEIRLGFDGPIAGGPEAAAPAAPAPVGRAAVREEDLRYRLGLAPRREGGRVTGFTVRANADLPALERAGIRPGDVILRVDGAPFDEQGMAELAGRIANSPRTEFEIERGGRRIRLALTGR